MQPIAAHRPQTRRGDNGATGDSPAGGLAAGTLPGPTLAASSVRARMEDGAEEPPLGARRGGMALEAVPGGGNPCRGWIGHTEMAGWSR